MESKRQRPDALPPYSWAAQSRLSQLTQLRGKHCHHPRQVRSCPWFQYVHSHCTVPKDQSYWCVRTRIPLCNGQYFVARAGVRERQGVPHSWGRRRRRFANRRHGVRLGTGRWFDHRAERNPRCRRSDPLPGRSHPCRSGYQGSGRGKPVAPAPE